VAGPARPLRVLHLSHPVDGGVARVLLAIARDQQRRGWSVVVATPAEGELPDALRKAGLEHRRWDAVKVKRMAAPSRVRALRELIDAVDPDLVHLHSASAGLAGRLALRGRRPTVFQPHGWTWQSGGGVSGRLAVAWERFAQRYADRIVCVSEAELRAGRSAGLSLTDAVVVPNGVDVSRPLRSRSEARARLGLDQRPLAVCVGRLDEQKGQQVLLQAWSSVVSAVPTARLVLVGDGPSRDALSAYVEAHDLGGHVELVGARPDVEDWYAAADVVAFSSAYGEGMPLVPLEAQAAGRSLVASDLPGVREAMAAGAGALVPPGDVEGFAAALTERLREGAVADAEGLQGRQGVAESFDLSRSLERLAQLTLELVRRPVSE
jgi:glycosyltransferase involved in cell wall biosynthesis